MAKILQLKISFKDAKPPIWRRVLVEDSITFDKLHRIIQAAMGWENYHLYMFNVGGLEFGVPDPDDEQNVKDSRRVTLAQHLTEKQKFFYTYDFGDNWEHAITVETILEKEPSKKYPLCIAGARACPPEDCGGAWGYAELMEIRKDKGHPKYEERVVEWLGEDYDPEQFDMEKANKELAEL